MMDKVYSKYYLQQAGCGLSDIGPLYTSPYIQQRGSGIGSFFGGLFRYLKPVLTSSLGALKDQSIKSGAAILQNMDKKPFKDVLKDQGKTAIQELAARGLEKLAAKQRGDGRKAIKRRNAHRFVHSLVKRKRVATKKKQNKKTKRVLDIFD